MIFSKLKYFFAASLALLCATAFSVDFGGAVRNSTNFKGTSFSNIKIDQIDDVNVWVKIPFTKSGNVYFTAEGLYEFEYDGHAETAYNRLDIDLFKLSASFQLKDNSLNINAGRFIYADLTGLVFNQNADGTFVGFNTPYFGVSIYGAYTGLLNACLVSILDNPLDPYTYDAKAPYDLAQKYAVGSATISFPAIAKTQNISAQFFGAFKVSGTSYNRMYATVSAGGPIYKTFYYNVFSSLGLQSYDGASIDISNMSRIRFVYYAPFKNLTFNLSALYASGSNGPFEAFRGFTKIAAYNAFNDLTAQHTGIFKGSLSASIKPLGSLLIYAGADIIINAATSSIGYKGFQYNIGANWQIFSDLCAGLSMLQYIDKDDSNNDKVQFSLNASITF